MESPRRFLSAISAFYGSSTPGGRLFPAPVHREIQVVAWHPDGSMMSGLASLPPDPEFADWTYVVVRAVLHDEGLGRLDALYETTTYPCDLLWGPGRCEAAAAWLQQEQPADDEVDVLDRPSFFQCLQGRLYLPRSPDVVAGLTEGERRGTWYLIRADYPSDALTHARSVLASQCVSWPSRARAALRRPLASAPGTR